MAKKVFVTGAAGQTGQHVLRYLEQQADKVEVYAGVYTEHKEAQEKMLKQFRVKTAEIDADDVKSLVEPFKNVNILFIIPSAAEAKVHQGLCYVRAAKMANVKFVLLLSMYGGEERNYLFAEQFHEIEVALENSGIENYAILRSNFYMQNFLLYDAQIKAGKLPLPIKRGKFAPLDVDDVGRAAMEIMLNPSKHSKKCYDLTGPESMTGDQMAEAFHKALGKPVQYEDIGLLEAKKILRERNLPASEILGLLEFYELVAHNHLGGVSDDFQKITGDKPHTLEDWVRRNASHLK